MRTEPKQNEQNEQSELQGWQKMLAKSYTQPAELLADLEIEPGPQDLDPAVVRQFPMRVPVSFVRRMKKGDLDDPLIRQVLPVADELSFTPGFSKDPLAEKKYTCPGLLHKYANRVAIMVTDICALNCRYCFRRYFSYRKNESGAAYWESALDYVRANPSVNEVIFSGGDPLMVPDNQLQWLVDRISRIAHVKRLRIHTRLPVVIPERITPELLNILGVTRLQTLLVFHINHADEINDELSQALLPLKRAGITLLNQGVLLKGVNDAVDTLVELSEKLFDTGILPYYMHMLDRVQGAGHFLVPDERARELMAGLMGRVAGYLVPRLTRETSGRDSKVPLDLYLE